MMLVAHLFAIWVMVNALVFVLLERAGARRERLNKREVVEA